MKIKAVKIEPETALKIFERHTVAQEEVYETLKNDRPIFRQVGGDQYLAIGSSKTRYITLFFRYDSETKECDITTAYPSDKKQVKFFILNKGQLF